MGKTQEGHCQGGEASSHTASLITGKGPYAGPSGCHSVHRKQICGCLGLRRGGGGDMGRLTARGVSLWEGDKNVLK